MIRIIFPGGSLPDGKKTAADTLPRLVLLLSALYTPSFLCRRAVCTVPAGRGVLTAAGTSITSWP